MKHRLACVRTMILPRQTREAGYACLNPQTTEEKKAPDRPRPLLLDRNVAYLREVLIELNLVFRLLPRPLTTAIMASEMPAAMRPYSMAVAPEPSFTKSAVRFFKGVTPCCTWQMQ